MIQETLATTKRECVINRFLYPNRLPNKPVFYVSYQPFYDIKYKL